MNAKEILNDLRSLSISERPSPPVMRLIELELLGEASSLPYMPEGIDPAGPFDPEAWGFQEWGKLGSYVNDECDIYLLRIDEDFIFFSKKHADNMITVYTNLDAAFAFKFLDVTFE